MEKTVTVKAFGLCAEALGCQELQLPLANTVRLFRQELIAMYPSLANQNFRIAVNQELRNEEEDLHPGDTLALLPPFSGG